ncbi:MAG: hypothetical protein ACOVO2_11635 [Emticicia sp.]|uniref:hypothetical protein n=1 Tax=Emticicia sp. TaxID=1930953 RepID=UPI003BA64A78
MNETKLNIIADFLNGKLSATEKDELLAQLESDAELKAEFEKLQQLKAIAERNRILDEVRHVHEQKIAGLKVSKGKKISLPKASGIAAAASVVFMLYLGNADFDYIQISNTERGESTQQSALTTFEDGLQLLKQSKTTESIEKFNQVANNQSITDYYRDAARWYKVVALVEMNKDSEAKTLLSQIENSTGFTYKISWLEKWKLKVRLWF